VLAKILRVPVVNDKLGPTKVGIGLDDDRLGLATEVVRRVVVSADRPPLLIGEGVGLDDGGQVVGLAVADGSKIFITHSVHGGGSVV